MVLTITLWMFLYGMNFIQYWMVLIITLWMVFAWNKLHLILDGIYWMVLTIMLWIVFVHVWDEFHPVLDESYRTI